MGFLTAGTYQEALCIFELNGDAFELLIADISLPGGNGCELAIVLRKQKPDLRVLFISGDCGAEICKYYSLEISDEAFSFQRFEIKSQTDFRFSRPLPDQTLYRGRAKKALEALIWK